MGAGWTFLVYLAGDNNLDAAAGRDLREMAQGVGGAGVTVAAQVDRAGDGGSARYVLKPGVPLAGALVERLPERNTGDPAGLVDFVRWGLGACPAEHTALILWNHGTGWKDDDLYAEAGAAGLAATEMGRSLVRSAGAAAQRGVQRSFFRSTIKAAAQARRDAPPGRRAILFDDTSRDFLDTQELTSALASIVALRDGRKLDLIGFDACLMNMVEIAVQVAPYCDWMVGSQEIEPEDGWPYDAFLSLLSAFPTLEPAQVAESIVASYELYYKARPPANIVTQSAVSLGGIEGLVAAVDGMARTLISNLPDSGFCSRTLLPALRNVGKFRDEQYVDLTDLAGQLCADGAPEEVRRAATAVMEQMGPAGPAGGTAVAGAAVATRAAVDPSGAAVGTGGGLSIYLPLGAPPSPAYRSLAFARSGAWADFLDGVAGL